MRRLAVLLLAVLLVAPAMPSRAQQPSTGYVFPYNLSGQLTYSSYLTSSMWRFQASLVRPDNVLGVVVAKVDEAAVQVYITYNMTMEIPDVYYTEEKMHSLIIYLFMDDGTILYYEESSIRYYSGYSVEFRHDNGTGDVFMGAYSWYGCAEPWVLTMSGSTLVNRQTGDVVVEVSFGLGCSGNTPPTTTQKSFSYKITGDVDYVAVALATAQLTNVSFDQSTYPTDPAYIGELNWWSYTPGSEPLPSAPSFDPQDTLNVWSVDLTVRFSGAVPTPYIVSGSAGYTGVTASYTPTIIDVDIPPAGGPGFETPAAILMAGLFIVVFVLYYRETGKVGVSLFLSSSLSASFIVIATQSLDFMPPLVIISIAGLLLHAGGR